MDAVFDILVRRISEQHGPLVNRLRSGLTEVIEAGMLSEGEALPSERDLATRLNLSRSTIRQCLKDLAEAGVVHTRQGVGTVVTGYVPKVMSKLSGFSEDMRMRGLVPITKVLERTIQTVPYDTALRSGLPLETETMLLRRLRLAGDEALSYEYVVIPISYIDRNYDGKTSLFEHLDAQSSRPKRILQSLMAIEACDEISSHLGIPLRSAVLRISQTGYDEAGSVIMDAISWYRGDRYKYVGEIKE
ncbi:GntR family transcriptional regulator [Kiloniella sp. EL199]|uniref:GntR family transcriptional regulator n=1 Tax=Kiloniella sp. EL199 TaxID=2107581 RepID=UPI000EA2ADA5|nr:GntR family transcriptional regulator [Kiloniella sp. EL199]